MLKQIIFTITVAVQLMGGAAFAKSPMNCADFLAPASTEIAKPFQYEVSDFEGLYVEILRDVALFYDLPAAKQAQVSENLLKKKATFLNHAIYIVRQMRNDSALQSIVSAEQLFAMISSMGVDPKMYALNFNEATQDFELKPASKKNQEPVIVMQESQGFIGFLDPKGSNERDLPDHLKRAIGFGREGISQEAGPSRRTNELQFGFDTTTKMLIVYDPTSLLRYTVDPQLLSTSGAETDEKIMRLMFNDKEGEWFVAFENLANPEGTIGFTTPN